MPPPTAFLLLALIIHNFYGFVQRNVYVIRKLWHGTPACVFSHRADATPIRYCTNYAYNLSMLDETVATRPPWLDSSYISGQNQYPNTPLSTSAAFAGAAGSNSVKPNIPASMRSCGSLTPGTPRYCLPSVSVLMTRCL